MGSTDLRPSTDFPQSQNYSPYADWPYPTRVYWGDQHLHTSHSPDAGLVGDRLTPKDAFRFAQGEQVRSSNGQLVRLERPYDWLVVSDHAEYMGLPQAFQKRDPDIMKTKSGAGWAEALKEGGQKGYEAFVQHGAQSRKSIDWHDFDEFGVPSPCPREWRPRITERWLQLALENQQHGLDTGLVGGAIMGEIPACPSAPQIKIRAALLDCHDVVRLDRLRIRGTHGVTQEIRVATGTRR